MTNKKFFSTVAITLLVFFQISCSEPEEIPKSESILGYWQALEIRLTNIDGIPQDDVERGYYIKFLENNCGKLYNRQEEWTNDFKWSVQEGIDKDKLLISTALNANGEPSFLHTVRLHTFIKYVEMNFRTHVMEADTINGVIYDHDYLTYFVRQ